MSHEKEEMWAIEQNKKLRQNLPQPNYAQLLGQKAYQKRGNREPKSKPTLPQKKFLNVDVEMKGEQQLLKHYEVYAELGKGAYGVVKMGLCKETN